jgi:glycine oxidase
MTLKSALDLLGSAYALNPAFGEASILDLGAGVRPAFPDNVPRIVVEGDGRMIRVNGAYRHGFLLAPVLAQAVAGYLSDGLSKGPFFDRP